jgi:hypothetical protein
VKSDIELKRYELHQNSPDNEGYVSFLKRMYTQITNRIDKKGLGLDFGSGPTPLLRKMFTDYGYRMNIYDYYYAPSGFTTFSLHFITGKRLLLQVRCLKYFQQNLL